MIKWKKGMYEASYEGSTEYEGFSLVTTSFIEKSNLFEQMYNSLDILVW